MRPRILFMDHAGVLGGAEWYLLDAARRYRDRASVVLFEDGPFYECLRAEHIDVHIVEASEALLGVKKQSSGWQAAGTIVEVIRVAWQVAQMAGSYDMLFANSQKSLVVATFAGLIARRPVIWNLHDILTAAHFSTFNRRLVVFCANFLVDRVIVNSRATQAAFAESGGRIEKSGIVYNGIDATLFEAISPEAVQKLHSELALSDAPVLGVFSRLATWKGQHVLLKALESIPEVQVLFIGEALFEGDHQYADTLMRLTKQLGLEKRVHFLGFRRDVPRLMKLVDVVVHTSVAPEPFGRVIVEGMLARKPVVASKAGGALEIIEDGRNGLLVPPGDPLALAEALRRLLDHQDQATRMVDAGYETATSRFSMGAMMDGLERQIQAVRSAGKSR